VTTRLVSLLVLLASWQIAAHFGNPRLLPGPVMVFATIKAEVASRALFAALSITIARVAAAFILAIAVGSAIGYAMGRNALFDRMAAPWIVVLLALPALVIIVLAYVWMGLNETAAIGAVALNKLPNAIVTIREGVRALDAGLDEMASVFGFSWLKRLRHVVAPQLAAGAVFCRGDPLGPVARLENRAGRRVDGSAEWSGFRNQYGVPAVRRRAAARVCAALHRDLAHHRNALGATL
jgi:ABC-type nitrate/sulfonate/bicarbonate transport system permease component